jgi:Ferric iron reductase FhuF-like transporter/FhuF 2Fe-2S C-terminal domain
VGQTRAEFEQLLSDQLTPLRGRYKDVGIHLDTPPDVEIVPGAALLDRATLTEHITRFGERIKTTDLRIAGVHWAGQLGYAVLPPIEMAMVRAGIGLDASLTNLGIIQTNGQPAEIQILDSSGTVVLPERYHGPLPLEAIGRPVASADELRQFVLDGLFGKTFLPLIESIHAITGVSLQVLWGQVSYEADLFFQQLARVAPEERTSAWEEDRAAFFERSDWSVASGRNPLLNPTRVITLLDPNGGEPTTRTLRSYCCLIYKVPTSRMCSSCPLAPKRDTVGEKLATVTERRAARAAGD